MVPNNDIIGVTSIVTGDYDAGLDFLSIASANPDALVGLILEPKSTERSIYVAGLTRTGNEPDLRSSFLLDGARDVSSDATGTIAVKGVDAREIIAPGDVLHAEDDAVIGTVATVAETSVVLTSDLPVDLGDEDKIHILQPIKLMIGVEY